MEQRLTVWITGAGSGIGKALCLQYASKSSTVILSGRNETSLHEVAEACRKLGAETVVLPLDLSKPEQLDQAVVQAKTLVNSIDILINNGGVSQRSFIADTPLSVDRQIFEVNYFGTIALTKAVLPWMVEQGGGTVCVISSISGLFGFPLRSAYSASKHAVVGFFETLGLEYIRQNIHTTIVFPGRILTDISMNAITKTGEAQNIMDAGIRKGMASELCAAKIVRAIHRKKRRVMIGRMELLLAYFHKYLHFLFWKIAPRINPK